MFGSVVIIICQLPVVQNKLQLCRGRQNRQRRALGVHCRPQLGQQLRAGRLQRGLPRGRCTNWRKELHRQQVLRQQNSLRRTEPERRITETIFHENDMYKNKLTKQCCHVAYIKRLIEQFIEQNNIYFMKMFINFYYSFCSITHLKDWQPAAHMRVLFCIHHRMLSKSNLLCLLF